jgi:hypothetical protein
METEMKNIVPIATAVSLIAAGAAALAQPQQPSAPPGGAQVAPDSPVTAPEARQTAQTLAGILEETYVFPDIAANYAKALRTKASSGEYDEIGTAQALAQRLTADIRAIAPDNHLRVIVGPPAIGGGGRRIVVRNPAEAAAAAAAHPGAIVRTGPAPQGGPGPRPGLAPPGNPIEQARWLAPGIAYIRFNLFPGGDTATAAAAFLAEHADAKTVIFDLRTHRGGGLAEMDAMLPYLFAKPTTLVDMDTRGSVDRARGGSLGDSATLRRVAAPGDVVRREHVVSPHPTEKRLFDAKVILLTSSFTGSAAEHFSLAMKRTGRATLIGEATAGAGNYGGFQPVGDKFNVFVPVGRTFDPDTGKGWEGTGVSPNIEVPAERALVEALVRSGVAQADAERLSQEVRPEGPMTRIVERH